MPDRITIFFSFELNSNTEIMPNYTLLWVTDDSATFETLNQIASTETTPCLVLHNTDETALYCDAIETDSIDAMYAYQAAADSIETDYVVIAKGGLYAESSLVGIERALKIAESTQAPFLYGNYLVGTESFTQHIVNPYQIGSLRDDFDFGPIQIVKTDVFKAFFGNNFDLEYGAAYGLRLFCSRIGELVHIPEFIVTLESEIENSNSHFGYQESEKQKQQHIFEALCTDHLKQIGGLCEHDFKHVAFDDSFPVEVSVIIPVRNRIKTLGDAIESILNQKTNFDFNILVVDNHSTDGTTELIQNYTSNPKVKHIIPEATDLGIGGCWNLGINDENCGKFAVQLDSDDLYSDDNTLQTVVNCFNENNSAMVIGSYKLVDFDLNELPPGVIAHKEWTDDNGANNALRINGFGAPRAFYTPVAREIGFPNVSYGEDYAIALRISAEYKVGRIYDPIYLCRRWNDNTDAELSEEKKNSYNAYKDWVRTCELKRRILSNAAQNE